MMGVVFLKVVEIGHGQTPIYWVKPKVSYVCKGAMKCFG